MNQMLDPMLPRIYSVDGVRREVHDTYTIEISSVGEEGCTFLPGQFNMLYVFGLGEVPLSISGDPAAAWKTVHTTRVVGPVTRGIGRLKRKDRVGLRGPFGSHWPVVEAEGSDIILIAGGIGLAPLRPALYYLLAHREKYGKIVLLYGARSPDDILFRKELEKWRSRFDLHVSVTVEHAIGGWWGNVGFVTTLIPRPHFDPENAYAWVCGPEIMMRFTALELIKRGVSLENIFISMERNMKCAVGFCGHCQLGPFFICKDGPVLPYTRVQSWLAKGEI